MVPTPSIARSVERRRQASVQGLRFVGYTGVSIAGLMVPLFVYKISGNALYAGLCMLIEWIPKLGVYLLGGAIASWMGPRAAYRWVEGLRASALIGLVIAASLAPSLILVVACSCVLQCCNALSNTLFESLVTAWWSEDERALGHSQLIKGDLIAGLIAVPALSLMPAQGALWMGAIAFGFNFAASFALDRGLLGCLEAAGPRPDIKRAWEECKQSLREIGRNGPLLALSALSVTAALPGAMALSQLPFFFQRTDAELAGSAVFLAVFSSLRSVCAIGSLKATLWAHHRGLSSRSLMLGGIAMVLGGAMAMAWGSALWAQGTGAVFMSCGFYIYTVFARQRRQSLISDQARLGQTGALIAVEALSYVLAAGALMVFAGHLQWALCITAMMLAIATALHLKRL